MRIALLTIWHEKNYGAELQTYATVKAIKSLGHDVKVIDIRLSDIEKRSLKGKIAFLIESISKGNRKFSSFWHRYIPATRRYTSKEMLEKLPPNADIYVVGSDQVWNPDITKGLWDVFFLNFGKGSVKKVAYGSSFGTDKWEFPKLTHKLKQLLSQFNSISCREETGVKILSELGLSAECVLDPTLLFADYPELTGDIKRQNTLVYYPLHHDNELYDCARVLGERLELHVVDNKASKPLIGNIVWDCNSIEGWVRNIAESQFVLTRSFHGMVFSILYNRPFAIIGSKNNRSTRITNLLSKLGLENRYYNNISDLMKSEPWHQEIDYTNVNTRLKKLREESWETLKSMFEI